MRGQLSSGGCGRQTGSASFGCKMGTSMRRRAKRAPVGPRPSVSDPRQHLLVAVLAFVRAARSCPGVRRISLVGSLTTEKPIPKDADVLVSIDADMELDLLARIGRQLKGAGQRINLGGDVFLANENGRYIGRIWRYRECFQRVLCHSRSCGKRQHLNDDLQIVTLSSALIASPPIDLWPIIIRRVPVPDDTEKLLLAELEKDH